MALIKKRVGAMRQLFTRKQTKQNRNQLLLNTSKSLYFSGKIILIPKDKQ